MVGLRWRVVTRWTGHSPRPGPAVLVHNRVLGVSEPVVVARGVREATGRHVRTAGLVDVAPVATLGRMLGGVVNRRDELTGLLRSGALVGLPLARTVRSGHAGDLPTAALAPALDTGAKVIPVALVGHELGRTWRLLVGETVPAPRGPGPAGGGPGRRCRPRPGPGHARRGRPPSASAPDPGPDVPHTSKFEL